MDPEPVIRAAIELAQAQLKLGALLTEALLGIQKQITEPPSNAADLPNELAVERAAAAIRRAMLSHKDIGLASLLRANFPPDELWDIARAALLAAGRDAEILPPTMRND